MGRAGGGRRKVSTARQKGQPRVSGCGRQGNIAVCLFYFSNIYICSQISTKTKQNKISERAFINK